jgi:hypothetical protein
MSEKIVLKDRNTVWVKFWDDGTNFEEKTKMPASRHRNPVELYWHFAPLRMAAARAADY